MRRRYDGFRAAFAEAGVELSPDHIVETTTTYEDGRRLGERLRAEHPDATAVFATADILAIGSWPGLADAGVAVPGDVSVIGFDDLEFGGFVSPGLTTIGQDMSGKVAEAARILLDEIERERTAPRGRHARRPDRRTRVGRAPAHGVTESAAEAAASARRR